MRKKIMGIGIGLLTMTAVIWGYQNYKKSVPDGNEAVQSEKTVKRQETEQGKYLSLIHILNLHGLLLPQSNL